METIYCAICDRSLTASNGASHVAILIDIPETDEVFRELYPDLPAGLSMSVCWVCVLRRLYGEKGWFRKSMEFTKKEMSA